LIPIFGITLEKQKKGKESLEALTKIKVL
jgi:hypothetical protein